MILGDATRISSQWHDHLLARFDRFLVTGGLPAVVRAYATGEDHALVWRQIVADYEQDFIAIELARGGQPLAGWKRSSAGSEIDFIVKTGPATVPVECKASISVNLRHMRGLSRPCNSCQLRRQTRQTRDVSAALAVGTQIGNHLSASQPLSLSASQPLSLSASQPLSLSASQPLRSHTPSWLCSCSP